MKKLFLSFLLTTTTFSLSCMEKEKPKKLTNYEVQFPSVNPSTILPVHTLSMYPDIFYTAPIHTNNIAQLPTQHIPVYCEANQPGWEFYDDIMNTKYHSNQSAYANEIELKPIYKTANTTIVQQETKSLIKTNSLRPNKNVIKSLYNAALHIVTDEYFIHKSQHYQNEKFVQIIKDMNNAKNNDINEDFMAKFAYEHKNTTFINNLAINPLAPLIFILLKKYNATVQTTGELLPPFSNSTKPSLKEILQNPTHTNNKSAAIHTTTTGNIITQYPAFFKLIYNLRNTVQECSIDSVKIFTTYLYKDNNILLQDYSEGSYNNFKSEFYDKAYRMLILNPKETSRLHDLLQMIDRAKEVGDINDEDDLIEHMAAFKEPQPSEAFWHRIVNSSHLPGNICKRIVLFCKLVKDYNNKRGFKITPTLNQHHACGVKLALDCSLPESLTNKDLLDEKSYAFAEIANLQEYVDELIQLNTDEVANFF